MSRRASITTIAAVGALLAVGPAGAGAATLTPTSYTALPGEANNLTVTDLGAVLRFVDTGAPMTAAGCTAVAVPAGTTVDCPEGGSLTISLNDLADQTTFVGPVDLDVFQDGGAGIDTLRGGAGSTLNSMDGGPGSDTLAGGTNLNDHADYSARVANVSVSLDNVGNDGEAGEGDNVQALVEDVETGAGNDSITGSPANNRLESGPGGDIVSAGNGDDFIDGDTGNDSLSGETGDDRIFADAGIDSLSGGEGDDELFPGNTSGGAPEGADVVSGGGGLDYAEVYAEGPGPAFAALAVSITLDDIANDGIAAEGDNYRSDIEDLYSGQGGNDVMVGTAAGNILWTDVGADTMVGGAGNDVLSSGGGNDTINSRDGWADRVECGTGTDTAVVDTLDAVSARCETIQTANVGNANDIPEDNPPAVAFAAPAENALIPGSGATVTVNAADDHGIARVVLFDDGRVVGTDTVAPYQFLYRPRGADLGPNTLIAMAFDGRGQSATALRSVRVGRFNPTRVTETVTPSRDRLRPFRFRATGAVQRPSTVSAAQGCQSGTVTVTITRGSRRVGRRTVNLRRNCTYAVTVTSSSRGRLGVKARFNGNSVFNARSSATRNVRAG